MNDHEDDTRLPPMTQLDGMGESCATLTPRIAASLRHLPPGGRLELVTDDPSAPEALASWARLTGNRLLESAEQVEGRWRFVVERKP